MYDPIQIANYFVEKGINENRKVTPMKALKLVYISYGWYLALKGEKLFAENIQAWTHGPVIPSVYNKFKPYGRNEITAPEKVDTYPITELSEEVQQFLDKIWEKYGSFNGLQLSSMSHRDGTPWKISVDAGSTVINEEVIKSHYKSLAGINE